MGSLHRASLCWDAVQAGAHINRAVLLWLSVLCCVHVLRFLCAPVRGHLIRVRFSVFNLVPVFSNCKNSCHKLVLGLIWVFFFPCAGEQGEGSPAQFYVWLYGVGGVLSSVLDHLAFPRAELDCTICPSCQHWHLLESFPCCGWPGAMVRVSCPASLECFLNLSRPGRIAKLQTQNMFFFTENYFFKTP